MKTETIPIHPSPPSSPVRFFPHEVADLSIALAYMLLPAPAAPPQDPPNWALRYVVLLWLSLVCRLPFDLAQFDDDDECPGRTAARLDALARGFLGRAGLEREGAVALLSRLYTRYVLLPFFWLGEYLTLSAQKGHSPSIPRILGVGE
jgi:tubulin-specific chaperone D